MFDQTEYQRKELWRRKFPKVIGALLSTFQFILTMVIVGCEVGGNFVYFNQMNIFVGYWTFPLFMCAWISVAGASCCCRIRCCGITALVFQCLAIPMALCVVGFDGYFLNYPTQCYFTNCSSSVGSYSYSNGYYSNGYYDYTYSTNSTLYTIKVPLIKGQLAAGALMLTTCVIYIIIFGVTSYLVAKSSAPSNGHQVPVGVAHPTNRYQNAPPYIDPTYGRSVQQNPAIRPATPPHRPSVGQRTSSGAVSKQLICPNCRSTFEVSATRY